jgi:predicted nuclease of predicted toxin-antitoxin system
MRFLADESCDFAVVRALRAAGHDVLAIGEVARGAKDTEVIRLAQAEGRVLLTEDRDFGRLVYAGGQAGAGVVFLRFPAPARRQAPAAVLQLVSRSAGRLPTSFVVLEPGRARIGSTPK